MRILVVEDDCDLADNLCRALEGEGFACDVAFDGVTGLEKALAASMTLSCSTSCYPP